MGNGAFSDCELLIKVILVEAPATALAPISRGSE